MTRPEPLAAERQRRTVRVLVVSQVLGGVGVASGIAVGSLLAEDVSGSTSLAGLAQTGTVLGAALLAVPLARLADSAGRRPALASGYVVGLLGAVLTIAAAVTAQFWLVLVGAVLFGGATASNLQARYAATDFATDANRGRSLSIVVWATTIGAVAGPNLIGAGGDVARAVGLPPLAGPFLFSIASFAAGAAVVLVLLGTRRVTSRAQGEDVDRAVTRPPSGGAVATPAVPLRAASSRTLSTRAVLTTVWRVPRARLALVAIAGAHAVMVGVMVMTPVHLGHGGASLEVVGVVISVHIAGMYAASPVMGWLTDRIGRVRAVAVGVGVLLLSLVVAATSPSSPAGAGAGDHAVHGYGTEPVQVGIALTLLGLGWSCCVVAGSTLLSESVSAEVRLPAQGASDLVMGVSAAGAGALAGPVLDMAGYSWLSVLAALLLVPVLVIAARLVRGTKGSSAVGAGV